jgi:hypothetical protein
MRQIILLAMASPEGNAGIVGKLNKAEDAAERQAPGSRVILTGFFRSFSLGEPPKIGNVLT